MGVNDERYLQALLGSSAEFYPRDHRRKKEENPEIYKEVLNYPEGTEHLQFFEKNPHPERFPQEALEIIEQLIKKNLNPPLLLMQHRFEQAKAQYHGRASEKEKLMLRLPEKMQAMLDKESDEHNRKAEAHLRDCFLKYFSTQLSENPDPLWIEYLFATAHAPAQSALEELRENLFNEKASINLAEKLRIAGAFQPHKTNFYFWNTDPRNWSDISYQARSVSGHYAEPLNWINEHKLNPQYVALGDYTINAIPEGYVEPLGNGRYNICVTKMYFFVNDMFNFEGNEYLGSWDLEKSLDEPPVLFSPTKSTLWNSSFRGIQRFGYGRYFPVLSRLHEVENFKPECLRYPFDEKNF